MKLGWYLFPLGIFGLLVIFLWRGLALHPQELSSVKIGQTLPQFSLPVLTDKALQFTPATLQQHVSVLNVWASWCSACQEEQVFLLQLAREGVPLYGLNYKDRPHDATLWLKEWGNPYRLIGTDQTGRVSMDLGVYGAPETFLIDKQGRICYRHVGILTPQVWHDEFAGRIRQLEGNV